MVDQEGAPLLNRDGSGGGSDLPLPLRYIQGALTFFFIMIGRTDGLVGLLCLLIGSTLTILISIYLGWFAGCFTMVLCFASSFCFGAGNAARGKYELAAPILLASLLLVASGILGSHFFSVYAKTSEGATIGSTSHPVPIHSLLTNTKSIHRAHIYMSDGEVRSEWTGEMKWCKDKIPVVGTCVYRYFCVAPIVPDDFNQTGVITAWAGVEWTTSCYGTHFRNAPERKFWDQDYRRGIGVIKTQHWDDAIDASVKKYGLKTTENAILMQWVEDPDAQQDWSWSMGWTVEITCLSIFVGVLCTYNYCSGAAKGAKPEARKVIFGPDDPVYLRYRQRTRGRSSTTGGGSSRVDGTSASNGPASSNSNNNNNAASNV